jgi:hypothetical protein
MMKNLLEVVAKTMAATELAEAQDVAKKWTKKPLTPTKAQMKDPVAVRGVGVMEKEQAERLFPDSEHTPTRLHKEAAGNLNEETELNEQVKEALDVPTHQPDAIAKLHGVSMDVIAAQLVKGIKVEMEHTTDKDTAREIALDHLKEDPKYYDKLTKVEETVTPKVSTETCKHEKKVRRFDRHFSSRSHTFQDTDYDVCTSCGQRFNVKVGDKNPDKGYGW